MRPAPRRGPSRYRAVREPRGCAWSDVRRCRSGPRPAGHHREGHRRVTAEVSASGGSGSLPKDPQGGCLGERTRRRSRHASRAPARRPLRRRGRCRRRWSRAPHDARGAGYHRDSAAGAARGSVRRVGRVDLPALRQLCAAGDGRRDRGGRGARRGAAGRSSCPPEAASGDRSDAWRPSRLGALTAGSGAEGTRRPRRDRAARRPAGAGGWAERERSTAAASRW